MLLISNNQNIGRSFAKLSLNYNSQIWAFKCQPISNGHLAVHVITCYYMMTRAGGPCCYDRAESPPEYPSPPDFSKSQYYITYPSVRPVNYCLCPRRLLWFLNVETAEIEKLGHCTLGNDKTTFVIVF